MIKKHELTRKKKEEDRTKLTDTQSANVGPVFLTYTDQVEIDTIVELAVKGKRHFDVITDDDIQHTVKTNI